MKKQYSDYSIPRPQKRLMVFLEGTTFDTTLTAIHFTPSNYWPIRDAVSKINKWYESYEIVLCTFHKYNIGIVRNALAYYDVHFDALEYRCFGESYADVVVRIQPDILIEDDCKSIGGSSQMCITHVPKTIQSHITSIIVSESAGISKLPDTF